MYEYHDRFEDKSSISRHRDETSMINANEQSTINNL